MIYEIFISSLTNITFRDSLVSIRVTRNHALQVWSTPSQGYLKDDSGRSLSQKKEITMYPTREILWETTMRLEGRDGVV